MSYIIWPIIDRCNALRAKNKEMIVDVSINIAQQLFNNLSWNKNIYASLSFEFLRILNLLETCAYIEWYSRRKRESLQLRILYNVIPKKNILS